MTSSKIVLVTGSSRGIGLGIVKEYLERGYQVLATCRDPEKATLLTETLTKHGQKPPFRMDVACEKSIKDCKLAILRETERLDVLVNNAGMSNRNHPDDPASTTDPLEFNEILNTNVTGVLMTSQAFLPLLLKSPEPRVINISSSLGSIGESPRFTSTSYQCSKSALNMLTKCLAQDVKGVVFVAVHPGWVQTDMGSSKNRRPPVPVLDSAKGIIDTAHGIGIDKTGSFVDYQGKHLKY